MDEIRKEVTGTAGEETAAPVREAWKRPEWRQIDASEAEGSFHSNTDGGIFS